MENFKIWNFWFKVRFFLPENLNFQAKIFHDSNWAENKILENNPKNMKKSCTSQPKIQYAAELEPHVNFGMVDKSGCN